MISPAELQVFGAEFTQTLRMRRKSIDLAAARLGVPTSEVTRWAQGEALPSEPQAHALDEYLTARGAIQNLITDLRSRPDRPGPRLVPVPVPSLAAPTLLQTFQNVAGAAGLPRQGRRRQAQGVAPRPSRTPG